MPTPITAQVLTFDRCDTIRRCLESLHWADEILVVDSGSTDGTQEIAQELADRMLVHTFEGHAKQREWGIRRAKHDWVLEVDSDEWVPEELAREIQEILRRGPDRNGYWVPRRSIYLGREIRYSGWQRDRVLRLLDRRRTTYPTRRIHEVPAVSGSVGRLRSHLMHVPYRSVADHLERIRSYSTLGARQKRLDGTPFRLTDLLLRPPWRLVRHYLLRRGFRDGFPGLVLAIMSSYYVFLKYLKLQEIQRKEGLPGSPSESSPTTP